MFRPQDFSSLEREKRLLFAESESEPDPMDTGGDPDFATPEPEETERTPREAKNNAERAIDEFIADAETTAAERMHTTLIETVEEDRHRKLSLLEENVEQRKKNRWNKLIGIRQDRKEYEESQLSQSFDSIAKKAVKKRNEAMLASHNTALHRIAERTEKTGAEFIFLEQKCQQIQSFLVAYRKQLEVYKKERARFERLATSLRGGSNNVFAGEIAQTEKMIAQLEALYKKEEERARQTTERQQVEAIKEKDRELRALLFEENGEHFSKVPLSELILEAVSGNPEPLRKAIREGVSDPAKRTVFLAAVAELSMETPARTWRARAYHMLPDVVQKRIGKEGFEAEQARKQALAYHYSNEALAAEKQLQAETMAGRMDALKKLPVGAKVTLIMSDLDETANLTVAGSRTPKNGKEEFIILRSERGGYFAVNPKTHYVWGQADKFTTRTRFNLSVPEEAKMPAGRDPTVLYLQSEIA